MPRARLHRYTRDFVFSGELPLYVKRLTHQRSEVAHDHDFLEIALVLGGTAQHHSMSGVRQLQAGDVIVLRPGAWHAYEACHALEIYDCCFGLEFLRRELGWVMADPALNQLFQIGPLSLERQGLFIGQLSPPRMASCVRLLDALTQELRQPSSAHRAAKVGNLLLFFDEVASCLGEIPEHPSTRPRRASTIVAEALELLEADVAQAWTTQSLAEHLNLTASYFVRVFKPATGLPPMAYLGRLRAERASELLLRTDKTITQIGIEVGWLSAAYFARRFKAHFGLTASEYRARFSRSMP